MIEGRPSATAQRVAAYRLGFERAAAPYGHPEADDLLARDVAAGAEPPGSDPHPSGAEPAGAESTGSESMAHYLRVRTAFFDRVVVNAVERGATQLVSIGAGYDGRSLRYAAPGVRWFEVDHPATSADKQARLARLDLPTAGTTFVAADLADAGLGRALVVAGLDPEAPTQYICEGVAVYLDIETVLATLRELRSVAGPGTRLALSMSAGGATAEGRARFQAVVRDLGEPVRSEPLTTEQAAGLFRDAGWEPVTAAAKLADTARRAGLAVLRPVWARATAPPSAGRLARYMEDMLHRSGGETLADHLEDRYGIKVKATKELDLGVFRIRHDAGGDWIARLGPPGRPPAQAESDAALLRTLARAGFPAERPAADQPASVHDGQGVLVTELASGRKAPARPATAALLGDLLGRLHALSGAGTERAGGAWHHLVPDGTLADELAEARRLWAAAGGRIRTGQAESFDVLGRALDEAGDMAALPHALVHADLVANNVIARPDGQTVVIDWNGAGQAPRVAAFGCLLWGCPAKAAVAAAQAYAGHVTLGAEELDALEPAFLRRPLILACWGFLTGRQSIKEAADYYAAHRRRAGPAAETAVETAVRAAAAAASG